MQSERVQVLAQQAAAGNPEAFVTLVQEFAPDLRLAMAVHLDQPGALVTVEPAVWSAVRGRLGEFIGDPPFASWIQQVAVDAVTAHLTQADRRAIDHQDALSHQIIEQCREALADGSELQVAGIRARLAALPEATRTLLNRRYRDRQRPSDIAASLMISESELATSLAAARAACDWRGLAKPPAAGDRLLPPLIEDWLAHTIDVDSRALLATNLGRDLERAAQFARQVRVHLALSACLTPFTREDALALVRQTAPGAADSSRVMMGEGPRPAVSRSVTSASSEARRPRMATSNRQVVTLSEDAPRGSPLPWIIGGGMVVLGVVALVLMSLNAPARTPAPRPSDPVTDPVVATTPTPTPVAPTATTPPPRTTAGGGSVLHPEPGRGMNKVPLPRIELTGAVLTGRAYIGQPLELRVALSHDLGVSSVEYFNGSERLGVANAAPWSWTWTNPPAGTAAIAAKVYSQTESAASLTKPLSIVPAFGTGTIRREWWTGVGGETLAQGYAVAGYPDRPHGESDEHGFTAPRNWGDSYLERMRGFIVPPMDGEYVFWIAGDDECELWLSEDDTRAKLRRIAWSPVIPGSGVSPEEWERDQRQRSAPIVLSKGRRYAIEALHKEGGGDDHLEVGWRLPDGVLERPIPGAHLAPPTGPVPAPALPAQIPVAQATPTSPTPPAVASTVGGLTPTMILWDGETKADGSGYASSGISKAAASGRAGSVGLQVMLATDFANIGWNWHGWFPEDAGDDVRSAAALGFWLKIDGANRPTHASLQFLSAPKSVQGRSAAIDIAALVPQFADGQWHQVVVPLERLASPEFNPAKVWEINLKLNGSGVMAGTVSIDDIAALPQPTAPAPAPGAPSTTAAPTGAAWKVVRAINLGGEATEIDGVRFIAQRQAEAEGATAVGTNQPGPWLDEVPWVRATNANGEVRRNRNWSNNALTIDGKVFAHGLGNHAPSEVVYALDGKYSGFTAVVGMDDDANVGEAIFQVWIDGQKAWDSGAMRKGMAKPLALPLVGRKELRLVVDPNGGNDWDHADWGNAQLYIPGGNDGMLQVVAGRKTTATFVPKPAVDAKARVLLGTALVGTKDGLSFKVKVPNGVLRVWLWLGESGPANSRQFDLTVEGKTMQTVGSYPSGGWEKLGPFEVTVTDGTVSVSATALKGVPQVMGILIEQAPSLALIADAFESTPVGEKAQYAVTTEDTAVPAATIRVTDETAANGKHSLKISDAPGQQFDWEPLLYYEPRVSAGTIECRFSLRVEAGAQMTHQWRGGGADPTRPGPSLRIDGEGRLFVQDKELLRVPLGQWFSLAVSTGLGPQANGLWSLAVTLPGAKEPQRFANLPCHAEFRSVDWIGFISYATQPSVYFLDDIEIGPPR